MYRLSVLVIVVACHLALAPVARGGDDNPFWRSLESQGLPTEPPKQLDPQGISLAQAQDLFRSMGERSASVGLTPDFGYDGCFRRAHIYEHQAVSQGMVPERIFIYANGEDRLTKYGWGYHTAVVLPVRDEQGNVQQYVFDPATQSAPVPVDTWTGDIVQSSTLKNSPSCEIVPGSTTDPYFITPPYGDKPDPYGNAIHWANDRYDGSYGNPETGEQNPLRWQWTGEPWYDSRLEGTREAAETLSKDQPPQPDAAPAPDVEEIEFDDVE